MPRYKYTAKPERNGKNVSGTADAFDESELAKDLRDKGLYLIKAEIKEEKKRKPIILFGKVSLVDKMMLTRNLQVMLSGGLSLSRALQVLSEQTKNQKLKSVLSDIKNDIGKGDSFSKALAKHPDVFQEVFRSMIELSEEAGTIEEVLGNLTDQMEKEHDLRSKIKGALIYPAVVVFAMAVIGLLMLTVFVPQLAEVFDSMNLELPLMTRIVIDFGVFISDNWLVIPAFMAVAFYGGRMVPKYKRSKAVFDLLLLRIPVVSSIVKKNNSAYAARTLSSLMSSGVPIIRSMQIVARSLSNTHFRRSLSSAADEMAKGKGLSVTLAPYADLYSPLMIQMIQVGEETGQTSRILAKTADFYEEEVTNLTKNLSSIIEPVLMLVIGAAIGVFAVSMIQPIYSIVGSF